MSEHANNFETEQERQDRMKKLYISLLWEAAHAYEYAEVNGTGGWAPCSWCLERLTKSVVLPSVGNIYLGSVL